MNKQVLSTPLKEYCAPEAQVLELQTQLNLLSDVSLKGTVEDFESDNDF